LADEAVRVSGLKELRAELRKVDASWPKEMRLAALEVAQVVAEGTQTRLRALGGSGPMAATTVKALAQQARAQVKGGGNTRAGQVFQGNQWGSVRYKQFPAPVEPDHGIFATIRDRRDDIEERYMQALGRITAKAFPD
jgi:hypothetical protein